MDRQERGACTGTNTYKKKSLNEIHRLQLLGFFIAKLTGQPVALQTEKKACIITV